MREFELQSSLHGLKSTYIFKSASWVFNPPVNRKRPTFDYGLARYELWNLG